MSSPNLQALVIATKAAKAQTKSAAAAVNLAAKEHHAKLVCIAFEKENRSNDQLPVDCFTPAKVPLAKSRHHGITCGEFVFVVPDLRPGICRHGGFGYIVDYVGDGPKRTFTVEFHRSSSNGMKRFSGIPYQDLSRAPDPAWEVTSSARKRNAPELFTSDESPPVKKKPMTLPELLEDAKSRRMGEGWRAKHLGVWNIDRRKSRSTEHDALFTKDLHFLRGFLSGRDNGKTNTKHTPHGPDGKFLCSNTGKGWYSRNSKVTTKMPPVQNHPKYSNPLSITYLCHAWGVSRQYAHLMGKKYPNGVPVTPSPNRQPAAEKPKQQSSCVIECYRTAVVKFTPKELYIQKRVHDMKAEDSSFAFETSGRDKLIEYRRVAALTWDQLVTKLDNPTVEYWKSMSRAHLALQPHMRDRIIESLRANPCKGFRQVECDINGWCSAATIARWLQEQSGYCCYMSKPLPLLSSNQKKKHVEFAQQVREENWGLPAGTSILLIHYDEKWFYGWTPRTNHKVAEAIGLEKQYSFLRHRNHVNKVMAVAFTGYAFEGSPENGGNGVKLGFYRCNAARIAKRDVRASRRDENDNLKYDGEVVREKGQAYMVDCCVTGSDAGTSDNPKFSLKSLFEDEIFPRVKSLVKRNGLYGGYIPVIQGDNAGPHIDAEYINFVKDYCKEQGWIWAPQAPQMPHANNLDLAVFPAMSKHHGNLLKNYSQVQAPAEEIWKTALNVWKDMPSSTIARGYVLAYRILKQVIKDKGDNTFLRNNTFHSNVRADFEDTVRGIEKKIIMVAE